VGWGWGWKGWGGEEWAGVDQLHKPTPTQPQSQQTHSLVGLPTTARAADVLAAATSHGKKSGLKAGAAPKIGRRQVVKGRHADGAPVALEMQPASKEVQGVQYLAVRLKLVDASCGTNEPLLALKDAVEARATASGAGAGGSGGGATAGGRQAQRLSGDGIAPALGDGEGLLLEGGEEGPEGGAKSERGGGGGSDGSDGSGGSDEERQQRRGGRAEEKRCGGWIVWGLGECRCGWKRSSVIRSCMRESQHLEHAMQPTHPHTPKNNLQKPPSPKPTQQHKGTASPSGQKPQEVQTMTPHPHTRALASLTAYPPACLVAWMMALRMLELGLVTQWVGLGGMEPAKCQGPRLGGGWRG